MIKQSTKDRAAGRAKEITGNAKKKMGRAMNRPDVARKGANEEAAGKARRKVGEVEKVFGG